MGRKAIGKYLSIARRAHAALLDQKLKPYNICHGQIMLLIKLYREERGIIQNKLCKTYALDKGGVNRSIEILRKNGYVSKKTDEKDKRKKRIYLTEKACEFKPVLLDILKEVEKQLRGDLSEEKLEGCLEVLREICVNLGVDLEN